MADFDLNKVLNIVDNDKGMARTLLEMTVDLGSADFNTMKEHCKNTEFKEAGKLAHKLKSSLATLGFTDVSEMMKDLEHYSKTELDPDVFIDKVNNIDAALLELFNHIRSALASELK